MHKGQIFIPRFSIAQNWRQIGNLVIPRASLAAESPVPKTTVKQSIDLNLSVKKINQQINQNMLISYLFVTLK